MSQMAIKCSFQMLNEWIENFKQIDLLQKGNHNNE